MMKTLLLLLTAMSVLGIAAHEPDGVSHRIRTELITTTDTLTYESYEYGYDSLGRLVSTLSHEYYMDEHRALHWSYDTTTYFTYTHDSVLRGRTAPFELEYTLDAQGRERSYEGTNVYCYDKPGHVVVRYPDGGTYTDSIADGDVIASAYYSRDSAQYGIDTYTYYPELDLRQTGEVAPPLQHRHLLRSRSIHQWNDHDHTNYYTYEYDSLHRVVTEICKGPGRSTIRKYTYY